MVDLGPRVFTSLIITTLGEFHEEAGCGAPFITYDLCFPRDYRSGVNNPKRCSVHGSKAMDRVS